MKIEVLPTTAEVAAQGAALFSAEVRANPALVAALPTGRTPIAMYQRLAAERTAGSFDLSRATIFNLDEVLLPKSSPQTFFHFMSRYVWDPLGVPPGHRFIPDGEAADPEEECKRYESEIAARGGLELAILGIGSDGHIAYNLPHQAGARTHVVTLDPSTIATLGGGLAGPLLAITMGVETILSAKRILLLATGSSKAEALRRMRDDDPTAAWPCTLFRDHPEISVIADRAAAAQL